MPEERELVTVVFADVVSSTAFGSDHDPEVVRSAMGAYFERMKGPSLEVTVTKSQFAGVRRRAAGALPAPPAGREARGLITGGRPVNAHSWALFTMPRAPV